MNKIIGYIAIAGVLVGVVFGGGIAAIVKFFVDGNWVGLVVVVLILLALMVWGRKGWK